MNSSPSPLLTNCMVLGRFHPLLIQYISLQKLVYTSSNKSYISKYLWKSLKFFSPLLFYTYFSYWSQKASFAWSFVCCLLVHLKSGCYTSSPTIYHTGNISYFRCVCYYQCVSQTQHVKEWHFCNPDRGVPTTVYLPDIPHLSSVLIRKISKWLMFPIQII